jgi:hypothetical protein
VTSFLLLFGLVAPFSSDLGERGALWKGDVVFMVQILPFCGWRYDLSQVGSLSEVTAPASRLIDETVQHALYRQHPCNVIRLVMNREEPGDASPADRTSRADDFLRLWKREGILLLEHETAFYIVETTFRLAEMERTRWSVIARLRLPDLFPDVSNGLCSIVQADPEQVNHELELRKVCQASLSPVMALLEDTTGEDADPRGLSDHLEALVRLLPPIECIDDKGLRHRIWPLTDQMAKTELESRLSRFSVFIVGGAAEIDAAVRHRNDLLATGRMLDPNDPIHTVLACLIPSDDHGFQFLPRVLMVKDRRSLSGEKLQQLLSGKLLCQFVGTEPSACEDAIELARLSDQQPCVAIGTRDQAWMIVSPGPAADIDSNDSLIHQIAALTDDGSQETDAVIGLRLPLHYGGLEQFQNSIFKSTEAGLMIVEPPLSPTEVFSLNDREHLFPEDSIRLYPDIPTGLVFSAW